MSQNYEDVPFEFLSAHHRSSAAKGTVGVTPAEMVLTIPLEGDAPYVIKGVAGNGYFEGQHEGDADDVPVYAAWAKLKDVWVGRWIEDGEMYLFSFRLPE